jgi:hypothetical protein
MKLFLSFTLTALCSLSFGAQIVLNQNAILNPGAELGAGSSDGNDVLFVPGWTTTGNFTSVIYGASAAPVAYPGPAFGSNFFAGGPNTGSDQATQIIDVSNLATQIDAAQIQFVLSGYFGGYLFQNDSASLFATFFDASDNSLGTSVVIGGHNSTYRNDISQLLFDSGTGSIPVGTRSVQITLAMEKTEGFYNDGYADNLSFVANAIGSSPINAAVPEPSTFVLSGLGAVWMLRKYRSRG